MNPRLGRCGRVLRKAEVESVVGATPVGTRLERIHPPAAAEYRRLADFQVFAFPNVRVCLWVERAALVLALLLQDRWKPGVVRVVHFDDARAWRALLDEPRINRAALLARVPQHPYLGLRRANGRLQVAPRCFGHILRFLDDAKVYLCR